MKYTAKNIIITSDLVYEGQGLGISYFCDDKPAVLLLSDMQLLNHLSDIGLVVIDRSIMTAYGASLLEDYMRRHLNKDLAKALVANYLNSRTVKPENTSI